MKRVRATVAAEIVLRDLPIRSVERLRFALSYPNPEYVKARRMRGIPAPAVPLRFECMTEWPDGSISIPRGAVDVLRAQLAADDLGVEFEDRRASGSLIEVPRRPDVRSYQLEAVLRLEKRTQGMVVLPPGAGKTRAGVAAIGRLGCTALVVVHTDDLLDQWTASIREHLGIEPGVVNAERKEADAPVVVASVLSLLPMLEADPTLGARFGLVVQDECHHVPAKTFQRTLRLLPAKYRLGLSATPEREDGHTKLVDWSFGPRLLVRNVEELVRDGMLMMPRLVEVPTEFEFEVDPDDRRRFTKLHRAIVSDAARNRIIAELAMWEALSGETVLLLSNRKPHCRKLGKMLAALGVDARVVVGTTSRAERKAALSELRSGEAPVVVATSLADEGLDVERLSRLILAFPEKARGKTVQRVGRLTRLWSGKDPVIYDVVDPKVETLARRASERRRVYRSIGMDV